jgi:ArsR family transcriptional regulator
MKGHLKKLKCLGDKTRIRILNVLLESKTRLCVCEIVDSLQIPFYTISKHIKELKNAGLVTESKDGKFVLYALAAPLNDEFDRTLLGLIRSIPAVFFKNDLKLLERRLALRERGRCVIGMNVKSNNKKRISHQ